MDEQDRARSLEAPGSVRKPQQPLDRAGDEPRRRALVRGFRFVVACDRFFIAELALPSANGQTSVRQPKVC